MLIENLVFLSALVSRPGKMGGSEFLLYACSSIVLKENEVGGCSSLMELGILMGYHAKS